MIVYYAHCMALYDTPQEERDVDTLKQLGFEVVNPNSEEVDDALLAVKAMGGDPMEYFARFAHECDALAFRSLPDGRIPSGVAKEIGWFQALHKPVIELPSRMIGRMISLEQTKEYLREVGQR